MKDNYVDNLNENIGWKTTNMKIGSLTFVRMIGCESNETLCRQQHYVLFLT